MRPWIDRYNGTEKMLKRLNKECGKCKKAGGDNDCTGYNPDCATFKHLKYFNSQLRSLLEENGGVK